MSKSINDLNNYLFNSLERLEKNKDDNDKLKEEIERSRAVVHTSNQIINALRLRLDAIKTQLDYKTNNTNLLNLINNESVKK